MTVLSLFALRSLGFTAFTYGLLLAAFGVASLAGASAAPRIGARLGSGRTIIFACSAYPVAWLLVAVAPPTAVGDAFLFAALPLQGLAAGIENSNEMGLGYWQALTPDELLGRVNATRRSVNRTMAALAALGAGLVVGLIGDRSTIIVFTAAGTRQRYRRCEKHPPEMARARQATKMAKQLHITKVQTGRSLLVSQQHSLERPATTTASSAPPPTPSGYSYSVNDAIPAAPLVQSRGPGHSACPASTERPPYRLCRRGHAGMHLPASAGSARYGLRACGRRLIRPCT